MNPDTPPDCKHPDGHAWLAGRPIWIQEPDCAPDDNCDDCLRTPDNVAYVSRQCRRCGYHDKSDPREVAE